MSIIALIDYGSGNLPSAEKALRKAALEIGGGLDVIATADPNQIARADFVVLPGVGAFAACMGALTALDGVVEAMTEAVRARAAPFLGICVGMQLLATAGHEFGRTEGLNWIAGDVRPLTVTDPKLKIPHMGWNSLTGALDTALFDGLAPGVHMYFTHSYAMTPSDTKDVSAWCEHGQRFAAAVTRGNIAGVQFHPEKSQAAGARLLGNFLKWRP